MTKSAHTPGPWAAHTRSNGRVEIRDTTGTPLCDMRKFGRPMAEVEANARLFATAPAVLAALEAVWNILPSRTPDDPRMAVYDSIRAAIRAAKGEG